MGIASRVVAFAAVLAAACGPAAERAAPQAPAAPPLRLVDLYTPSALTGRPSGERVAPPRTEWRFAGAADTLRWQAGPGVADLAVREGRLAGRATSEAPFLHVEIATPPGEVVHAVEVRARVSAGTRLWLGFEPALEPDLAAAAARAAGNPLWGLSTPLSADAGELRTYTMLSALFPIRAEAARHVLLRPSDAAGAEFAIESIRIVWRGEHLAQIASGAGWHGLGDVHHEGFAVRAGEEVVLPLALPARPRLSLELGTIDPAPVTFRAAVEAGGRAQLVLERTLTTPQRWEHAAADLSPWAGQAAMLRLSLASETPGALGFFGAPVVDDVGPLPAERPQGVILVLADTLRRDHLSVYGYGRATAPTLAELAAEGALFEDAIAQATWTKASTPSLFTGLYPSSHGVVHFPDRLSDEATTLAEVFRQSGYATLGFSAVFFTGKFSNLTQGYQSFHELGSIPERTSKTARLYVDRLLPWLDEHRDVPFFVLLHVFDPHDPYEPRAPYDGLWADPAARASHLADQERARGFIAHPLLRLFGAPGRSELVAAGIDPDAYIRHDISWYDGSIRGMDTEIRRVLERLRALGLAERTLLVVTSDHGEEFHEHGHMFHGQSLYAELTNVPLLLWGPRWVPAGRRIATTAQGVDLMPTILELVGLPRPEGMQGESLVPLLRAAPDAPASERLAFAEKALDESPGAPARGDVESVSVVRGRWKLVHNTRRPPDLPEYELFDREADPKETRSVAEQHPEVVHSLSQEIAAWRERVARTRLAPAQAGELSAEERERLRSLGYVE